MNDERLIEACKKSIEGFKAIDAEPNDTIIDEVYEEIKPCWQYAIETVAATIAGCAAKASLLLVFENEALLSSLLHDVISLGGMA